MCRIAAVVNISKPLCRIIHRLQANGATRRAEVYSERWGHGLTTRSIELVHSRFDVTSSLLVTGTFPYRDGKYVFHHNGEIFAFRDQSYLGSHSISDVHFASRHLPQKNISQWFNELDFQGTIQLYDKVRRVLYVAVDQLNTQGGFYAAWDQKVVVAEEVAIIEIILTKLKVSEDVSINKIRGGHFLEISESGVVKSHVFRGCAHEVFSGTGHRSSGQKSFIDLFRDHANAFVEAFIESVERRLPESGPVAVLCSGGIDSAYLLHVVCTLLKSQEALGRLVVFTLGKECLPINDEENDWKSSHRLFMELDKSFRLKKAGAKHCRIAPDSRAVAELYRSKVFCSGVARLITPNPILNTQVRHTVRMAAVLAEIAWKFPELKVVLSGDGADELFAGYNSMWENCESDDELRIHVTEKLDDLSLNDCARVALAAFHGTCAALKAVRVRPLLVRNETKETRWLLSHLDSLTAEDIVLYMDKHAIQDPSLRSALEALHPIEVRMPFTSHVVLETLREAHPAFLIGRIDGLLLSKFLLRVVAIEAGLDLVHASRKKVPFHEGGTGIRNTQRYNEEIRASKLCSRSDPRVLHRLHANELVRLALHLPNDTTGSTDEQVVCLACALKSGLARMLIGNVFRNQMPDCIYSTAESNTQFRPCVHLVFDTNTKHLSECDITESRRYSSINMLEVT